MTPDGGEGAAPEPELKVLDAWWTVLFVDPLAVRLVDLLEGRRRLQPTHLTVAAHLLGVVSAVCFALGWLVPAALIFEVRFVLDCADGKLARRRATTSATGAFLDYMGDAVVVTANLMGLALLLSWDEGWPLLAAIALPTTFATALVASRALHYRERTDVGLKLTSNAVPGRYGAWMARRRLRPLPSRPDVEHGLLFVAPVLAALVSGRWPLVAAAWLAVAYFTYETYHLLRLGYLAAAATETRTG